MNTAAGPSPTAGSETPRGEDGWRRALQRVERFTSRKHEQYRWGRTGPRLLYGVRRVSRSVLGPGAAAAPDGGNPLPVVAVRPLWGRVGSTLMMKMLSTGDGIVFDDIYPYENTYLTYVLYVLEPLGQTFYTLPDAAEWPTADALRRFDGQLPGTGPIDTLLLDRQALLADVATRAWQAVSDQIRAHSPGRTRFYAEKLSGMIEVKRALDRLLEQVDGGIPVQLIELVRDPRDIWASVSSFNEKRGSQGFGRAAFATDEDFLSFFIDKMRESFAIVGASGAATTSIVVRYEDLVRQPDEVADRVGRWLGVELDAGKAIRRSADFTHHRTSASSDSSIGRWRSDVKAAESEAITEHLAEELERFGYSGS